MQIQLSKKFFQFLSFLRVGVARCVRWLNVLKLCQYSKNIETSTELKEKNWTEIMETKPKF